MSIDLSLVLPAYNEEEDIVKTIGHLEKLLKGYSHEIIVVDDGSTDSTRKKAMKVADGEVVKLISYAKNRGKGDAIFFAMMLARGKAVGHIDSDSDIDPSALLSYLEALKTADIVIASKRHKDSKVSVPVHRRFLSWGFHRFIVLMTGVKASDTQTGLKLMRGEAAESDPSPARGEAIRLRRRTAHGRPTPQP